MRVLLRFNLDSFSFSTFLIAITSKTMLSNTGESGNTYLVLDCRGNAFSFSPLRIMFAVSVLSVAFIVLN